MRFDTSNTKLDLRFVFAAVCAFVIVVMDANSTILSNARSAMFVAVKPLIEVAQFPVHTRTALILVFEERASLRQRNETIMAENKRLRQRVIALENEELRNRWLAELLDAKESMDYPVLSSNILNIQLRPRTQKIVLDRGVDDQVFIGQPVIDHRGVIGQVSSATLSESAVTLITHPNHSLPVRIQRTGILAVAHGIGETGEMVISGLRSTQDVEVGDVLVTSGLGQRFPIGYPVAKVTEVISNKNKPFAEVTAAPLAVIDPSFEVLIVWTQRPGSSDETPQITLNGLGEQ